MVGIARNDENVCLEPLGLVIYSRSNPNRGFMKVVDLRDSLQEGSFNQINVFPLLACSPFDTLHKNKRSDKRFGYKLKMAYSAVLLNNS